MRHLAALIAGLIVALGIPLAPAGAQVTTGEVLAVVGRQVARINLALSRPRVLTAVPLPANAVDVAALPGSGTAAVTVTSPTAAAGVHGGELYLLDLASGGLSPLATRLYPSESLSAPAWLPDGSRIVFQREDLEGPLVPNPVHEIAHYPSRVEIIGADGTGRAVIADDARYPGPSPDGTRVVYVREGWLGGSLHVWSPDVELELVGTGRFADIAYPRYSPAGDRIAFLSVESSSGAASNADPLAFLRPGVARAHGFPWSVWLVAADGSWIGRLADPQADEASLAWSPDGSRLFVYSNTGAFVIDASTGALTHLPRWVGTGLAAWDVD